MSTKIRIRKDLLKRLRVATGISSEEAQARMLGVGRTTLHRINNGEQPSAAFMAAVCTTYGLGLGEAFELVEPSEKKAVA